jgi:bacteriocin-like protein
MNNQTSMGSIELTDKELAGVSGGKNERVIVMEPVTIVVFTKGSTIHGTPKK